MVVRRIAIAAVVALVVPTAALGSNRARRGRVLLHPHYRVVGHDGEATNGAQTILWHGGPTVVGTLIDERNGRRTPVRLPRYCRHPVGSQQQLGDSWLLADCARTRLGLYSLRRHRWRSIAIHGPCRRSDAPPGDCVPVAVGTHWIEYDQSSEHLGDRSFFQNITSGAIRDDPGTARTLADLDAPTLARRVCAPLRVPSDGTLQFEGRFALAIDSQGNASLGACATRLHVPAGAAALGVAIGPDAVIYDTAPHRPISGISLPSLRRFAVALPADADDVIGVDLSVGHIYVEAQTRSGRYDVWSARASALRPGHPAARG